MWFTSRESLLHIKCSVTWFTNTQNSDLVRDPPEGVADGVGPEVYDLQEVVPGAGEQLRTLLAQIQRGDPTLELQLPHDALRPANHRTSIPTVPAAQQHYFPLFQP